MKFIGNQNEIHFKKYNELKHKLNAQYLGKNIKCLFGVDQTKVLLNL